LAEAAQVKKFGIFHHEPERSDTALTEIETRAQTILPHSFVTRDFMQLEV
jgi:ribonuclease BN (tRNA processing enzyme)